MRRPSRLVPAALAVAFGAANLLAGFSGTDLFLPMVGRQAGVFPSNWYTTVWVYNPGTEAATARIYLLERGTANPSPPFVDVLVAPGDTEKLENVVEGLFHKQVFGALRVTCDTQKLVVTSRVYSKGAGAGEKDSVGQDFAGVPASFAIAAGETTEVLGVHQTLPAADSDYRFNFGFVETTGHTVNLRVRAFDGNGADQGFKDFNVREYSQRQVAFKDSFPTVSTDNVRLEVTVISGSGKIIAYGSGIGNGSQDPTTFEMRYADKLLGIANVQHDATLVGDGTAGAPLGLANGAVTLAKLGTTNAPSPAPAAGGVAAQSITPKVLTTTDGNTLSWQAAATGDITAVNTPGGSGLTGGVATGDANLAVAPTGITSTMLADGAVTDAKVASGIAYGKLSGVPTSLPPSGAAGGSLTGTYPNPGIASGQVVTSLNGLKDAVTLAAGANTSITPAGSTLTIASVPLALPYFASANSGGELFTVNNTGSGVGLYGTSDTGNGVVGLVSFHSNKAGVWGYTSGGGTGVKGESTAGDGVHGITNSGFSGVRGVNSSYGYGVSGSSNSGIGVQGQSTSGQAGVWGINSSTSPGVEGFNSSTNGVGVEGRADAGNGIVGTSSATGYAAIFGKNSNGQGVWGETDTAAYAGIYGKNNAAGGYGGWFSGQGYFSGLLTKAGGGFKIDHPLDPAGKYLQHSFVESPDMKDVYDGVVVLDALGEATVELPEWFEALNRDFRYQLTCIGGAAVVYIADEIASHRFRIAGGKPGMKVSWQVTGTRQDAWANANRLVVEEEKPSAEQGTYLHPELFGQPEEKSIETVRNPQAAQQRLAAERAQAPRGGGASGQ